MGKYELFGFDKYEIVVQYIKEHSDKPHIIITDSKKIVRINEHNGDFINIIENECNILAVNVQNFNDFDLNETFYFNMDDVDFGVSIF